MCFPVKAKILTHNYGLEPTKVKKTLFLVFGKHVNDDFFWLL